MISNVEALAIGLLAAGLTTSIGFWTTRVVINGMARGLRKK